MSQVDEEPIIHEVLTEFKASSLQNRVHHFASKVQLRGGNDEIQKGLLVDVMSSFEKKVDELLTKYIKDVAKPDDRAQIILTSDSMNAPTSTKMLQACDLTTDHILTTVTKSQNSELSLKFEDSITLEFVHTRKDKGWNNPGAGAPSIHICITSSIGTSHLSGGSALKVTRHVSLLEQSLEGLMPSTCWQKKNKRLTSRR